MKKRNALTAFLLLAFLLVPSCDRPTPQVLAGDVAVYFSPHGGCTDAIVKELDAAKDSVLVQAYSFTSAPIAKALMEAHK